MRHKTDVISVEQEDSKHELAETKGEVKCMKKDNFSVDSHGVVTQRAL
ncbi:hypothetical protein G9F73_011535 [Clostridium estertheticum]|nr:hypothetical protein [Clostridium estertheticum]MBZ9608441.1 hypothetical protein [Clostridium estertheticum]